MAYCINTLSIQTRILAAVVNVNIAVISGKSGLTATVVKSIARLAVLEVWTVSCAHFQGYGQRSTTPINSPYAFQIEELTKIKIHCYHLVRAQKKKGTYVKVIKFSCILKLVIKSTRSNIERNRFILRSPKPSRLSNVPADLVRWKSC